MSAGLHVEKGAKTQDVKPEMAFFHEGHSFNLEARSTLEPGVDLERGQGRLLYD
jgi:hypothetical protein